MKKLLIIPLVLVMACGGAAITQPKTTPKSQPEVVKDTATKTTQQVVGEIAEPIIYEDSLFLLHYLPESEIKYNTAETHKKIIEYIKTNKIDTVPYRSINRINKELNDLIEQPGTFTYGWEGFLLIERLKFHLSNPITYNNDLTVGGLFSVSSPDGRFKFSTYNTNTSVYGPYCHYMQYIASNGKVKMREVRSVENEEFDGQNKYVVTKIFPFRHNGTTYYALKSMIYATSSSAVWFMSVATFRDGEFTYHNNCIDQQFKRPNGIPLISEIEAYDFNPADLTFSYSTTVDGKKVKRTSKLHL